MFYHSGVKQDAYDLIEMPRYYLLSKSSAGRGGRMHPKNVFLFQHHDADRRPVRDPQLPSNGQTDDAAADDQKIRSRCTVHAQTLTSASKDFDSAPRTTFSAMRT